MPNEQKPAIPPQPESAPAPKPAAPQPAEQTRTPRHPDPTRYGDWEVAGRCIDF